MKKIISAFCIACISAICFSACSPSAKLIGSTQLEGTWQLVYMKTTDKTIDELFPEKKPTAVMETSFTRISGTGGCNQYSGPIKVTGNKIDMTSPIISTKMMCVNGSEGENMYFNNLPLIDNYLFVGDELQFLMGEEVILKYRRISARPASM